MWFRVRARTATILDVPEPGDRVSWFVGICLIALIVVNVVAVILESVDRLQARWGDVFRTIETVSLVIFSIEYVLRVWSIIDNRWRREYRHPVWGRLRFMRSPMAIIDLLAVALVASAGEHRQGEADAVSRSVVEPVGVADENPRHHVEIRCIGDGHRRGGRGAAHRASPTARTCCWPTRPGPAP